MKYSSSLSNPPPLPPPNTFTLVLSRDELLLVRQGLGKNRGRDGANMVLYKAIGALMSCDTPVEGDTSK